MMMSTLLRKELNLRSEMDNHLEEEVVESIKNKNNQLLEVDEWKDIKNKRMREKLLIDFVIRQQDQYQLTPSQTKTLLKQIHLGFILKTLSPLALRYEDHQIKSIDGMKWKGDGIFEFDQPSTTTLEKSSDPIKKGGWIEKYVKEHNNRKLTF